MRQSFLTMKSFWFSDKIIGTYEKDPNLDGLGSFSNANKDMLILSISKWGVRITFLLFFKSEILSKGDCKISAG